MKLHHFLILASLTLLPATYAADFPKQFQVLVVGNSISQHRPSKTIGWTNNWGMAASTKSHDYLRLLTSKMLGSQLNPKITIISVSSFERGIQPIDELLELIEARAYDLVILQAGDNVSKNSTAQYQFLEGYLKIAKRAVSLTGKGSRVACVGLWRGSPSFDQRIREVCDRVSGRFVMIRDLSEQQANLGSHSYPNLSESIQRHPGDKGMLEIANRIRDELN
jgi:hypothetical protein